MKQVRKDITGNVFENSLFPHFIYPLNILSPQQYDQQLKMGILHNIL